MRLLLAAIIFLLLIPTAYSWGWDTHIWICKQIYDSNKDLNKVLDRWEFIRGCIAPDKEYDDQINHHCYVAKECKTIDVTKTDPAGLSYFTDIEACIEDEYFDCPAMEKFDEALNNATKSNFSFYVGVATHYFTDSYVPLHQTMGEDYWECHVEFEKKIDEKIERNKKFWTVTQDCKVYFPCYKVGNSNRKCAEGYDAEITFAYEDIVEIIEKTDSAISERLDLERGDYSYLKEQISTGSQIPTGSFISVSKIIMGVIVLVITIVLLFVWYRRKS